MINKEMQEEIMASERRDSERKKLIVDVRFSGGDATGIANTRDIGIGGLYMTTAANLEIGTPVTLSLILGGKEFYLNGAVVYTDPGEGVGIRFTNLSSESENALIEAVNS